MSSNTKIKTKASESIDLRKQNSLGLAHIFVRRRTKHHHLTSAHWLPVRILLRTGHVQCKSCTSPSTMNTSKLLCLRVSACTALQNFMHRSLYCAGCDVSSAMSTAGQAKLKGFLQSAINGRGSTQETRHLLQR